LRHRLITTLFTGLCLGALPWIANAQSTPADQQPAAAPAAPAAPSPLPTPSITGPLSGLPPATFDAGPFGKISVNGFLTGMGLAQSNHVPGDDDQQSALSNGQIMIQKTDGWFQFYLQAGAYNILSLGTPFVQTDKIISGLYGAVPVAFLKLQAGKNTSFEIGSLPTLIGAEYTFSFENMNIDRGLLWNQENAVTASLAWSDGFYSDRYTWLSGSLAYANGPHAIAFVAGGNYSGTGYQTFATPVQNNGSIYNVIYTFTKGPWIVQPYYQYTNVPTNKQIGIVKGNSTNGGAILVSRAFKKGFSLPVRWEYIASTGSNKDGSVNLMYGPGSNATSITVTPTFQYGGFFFRGDVGYVHVNDYTPGAVFGGLGNKDNQTRVVGEIGFIFGNNISPEKK